jgi:predicted GIY-YIG superfamily endonuclease
VSAGTVYLLHFDRPLGPPGASAKNTARHYVGWAQNVKRRLAEHEAGRGARLLEVAREAGITWQLARMWPGSRARERQIKQQGGHRRQCPLCGVKPRRLPVNRDGSLSRSRTTDAQKLAAGVMTGVQQAEHTALRRGAVTGKPPRLAERGPAVIDLWTDQPAGVLAIGGAA